MMHVLNILKGSEAMFRTLLEECPICTDNMQCVVTISRLGSPAAHGEPINDIYLQWGTGNPPPPPTSITEDFVEVCPWCSQSLNCKVVVPYLVCEDVDEVKITMQVNPEEGDEYHCSNCAKDVSQLYSGRSMCRECYVAMHEAFNAGHQ